MTGFKKNLKKRNEKSQARSQSSENGFVKTWSWRKEGGTNQCLIGVRVLLNERNCSWKCLWIETEHNCFGDQEVAFRQRTSGLLGCGGNLAPKLHFFFGYRPKGILECDDRKSKES